MGLRGIVVKSHGNADRISFENAINIAVKLAEQNVVGKIEKHFSIEDGITSDSEKIRVKACILRLLEQVIIYQKI